MKKKNNNKKLYIIIASVAAVVVAAGFFIFNNGAGSDKTTFTYADTEIDGLDISQATYQQTFQFYTDIYEGIYEINAEGDLVPAGAESVDVSEDGLVYTVHLNPDAVWVDNTGAEKGSVTAEDYVFSYQRTVDPATASGYSYIFEPVKNATAISAGEMPVDQLGVKAIDDFTLEITLERPTPYFESMLAFPTFYPQPKAAADEYGADFATDSMYTWYNGPYYPSSYDKSYEIVMDANPSYHGTPGEMTTIVLKNSDDAEANYNSYQSGELSMVEITNPDYYAAHTEDGTINDKLSGYMFYLYLNMDPDHVTSNENLRQGIAYGFDRETVVTNVYGDIQNTTTYLVPEGMTPAAYDGLEYRDYANDEIITYDPEKANAAFDAYMAEMGYTDRSQIELTLLLSDSTANQKLGTAIQAFYAQEFGITINVDIQPQNSYVTKRNEGDFDMTVLGWGPDYADPSTYFSIWTSSAIGSINVPRLDDPAYDAAYAEATQITDPEARFEAFAALEEYIGSTFCVIPMYQKNEPYLVQDGINVPTHMFFSISHKYVTTD